MSLPSRLLGANPSIQVSTLLSGSLTTPSAKQDFVYPGSMEYISSATTGVATSSLTISSIPATYSHLHLRCYLLTSYTLGESNYAIRVNGDTGSNYYRIQYVGDGGTQAALGGTAETYMSVFYTYGAYLDTKFPMIATFDFINYSDTSMKSNILGHEGVTTTWGGGSTGLGFIWNSTTTINQISVINTGGGNLAGNSRIDLYGIKGS